MPLSGSEKTQNALIINIQGAITYTNVQLLAIVYFVATLVIRILAIFHDKQTIAKFSS